MKAEEKKNCPLRVSLSLSLTRKQEIRDTKYGEFADTWQSA